MVHPVASYSLSNLSPRKKNIKQRLFSFLIPTTFYFMNILKNECKKLEPKSVLLAVGSNLILFVDS